MRRLARSMPARELAKRAYALYEEFRPEIPAGVCGWGAVGDLDLDRCWSRGMTGFLRRDILVCP